MARDTERLETLKNAGALECHRVRSTRGLVTLYDAEKADMDVDGGPYSLVCERHSTVMSFETRTLARSHMPDVREWCEECRGDEEEDHGA